MSFIPGQLLVASPYLPDPNFLRSVVLMIEHDADHAFGLLLNRPGHDQLADVWTEVTGHSCSIREVIRRGGPLDGPLMVLHRDPKFADLTVIEGVYLATGRTHVVGIVEEGSSSLVAISGYSGWGPSQLDQELKCGGWMTYRATPDLIFSAPESMWKLVSGRIGDEVLANIELRHPPQDPSLN